MLRGFVTLLQAMALVPLAALALIAVGLPLALVVRGAMELAAWLSGAP